MESNAQLIDLNKTLEIPESGSKAKTLWKGETLDSYMLAFNEGESLNERFAKGDEIIIVYEGHMRFRLPGKAMHVRKGELLLIPAGDPYTMSAVESSRILIVLSKGSNKRE